LAVARLLRLLRDASGRDLSDLIASGLGVQGMLWQTSPACTEVETHVMDWLVRMLDLPAPFLSTSNGAR
jgi:aromatic-L-amino-acid decarboxylase